MARNLKPVMQDVYPQTLHNPSQTQKNSVLRSLKTSRVQSLVGETVQITYAALNRSWLMCAWASFMALVRTSSP